MEVERIDKPLQLMRIAPIKEEGSCSTQDTLHLRIFVGKSLDVFIQVPPDNPRSQLIFQLGRLPLAELVLLLRAFFLN